MEKMEDEGNHDCLEAEWRYLDCDKCDVCEIRICVECGADVDAPTIDTYVQGLQKLGKLEIRMVTGDGHGTD